MSIYTTPDLSGLGAGISQFGGALGQALQQRGLQQQQLQQQQAQQAQQQQYGTILSNIMSSIPENFTMGDIQNAQRQMLDSGIPLENVLSISKQYEPYIKQQLKETSERNILQDLGLLPGESPRGEVSSPTQLGNTPEYKETIEPPGQTPISRWTEDQLVLAQASQVPSVQRIADAEIKKRDLDQKRFLEDRKYNSSRAKKAEEEAFSLTKKIRDKKFASVMARDAIESGDVGRFSWANLAQRTGIQEFQTAKGAQLALAAKINLVGNLSDVSAKAQNMWLERVMSTAFAQAGQSENANLSVQELFDAEIEMNEAYLKNYREIAADDEKKHKFIKGNIGDRADQASQKEYGDIMKKVSYRTRQIHEREKGLNWMQGQTNKKVPKGSIATEEMIGVFIDKYDGNVKKALENMSKLGYQFPTEGELEIWR